MTISKTQQREAEPQEKPEQGTAASRTASTIVGAYTGLVVLPNEKDVLLRDVVREKRQAIYCLKRIIKSNLGGYQKASTSEKTIASRNVHRRMKESGSRFLKPNENGGWIEVEEVLP
jgi:hypothetical protein